ncbi:hypothetical protein ACFQ21_02605 [Ohtaekwangia kribbensis]|uniref:PH domain-containing protein n=1 Tax=Ohtaekwangia kribbensis TaxID=688913 RepID=A0ABW3JYS8_9BACT
MTLTIPYIPFWSRVRKKFIGPFIVITLIVLYGYFASNNTFLFCGIIILGFSVTQAVISIVSAWTFVNEVKFTEDKIIIGGASINTHWHKEFEIRNSRIEITSEGRGGTKIGYYFTLSSPGQSVDINRTFNWNYTSLLTIFNEFKRLKGEKIIFDEKYFLDIMEKKANSQN